MDFGGGVDICIANISLLKRNFSSLPVQSLQNRSTDSWAFMDPRLEATAKNQFNVLGGSFLLKLSFALLRNLPQMVTQADLKSA